MDIGGAAAAAGLDTFGNELNHFIKGLARQSLIRRGAQVEFIELGFFPGLRCTRGHDLLRQNIEGRDGRDQTIEPSVSNPAQETRAFDEFVAGQRIEPPLRSPATEMPRASDSLQESRETSRRTDLAN